MALAALISATREAREPGVALRATFWLAGRTLIERQARLAVTAGASQIIILVESFPAELVRPSSASAARGCRSSRPAPPPKPLPPSVRACG
jgi:hypothetical protein